MIRRVLARWLIIMTALLPLMTGLVWAEEAPEVSRHNTILIIDNSRSTTGRHSLGGAMGAAYAAGHADRLKGVVLLAAYATKKLDDSLKEIVVYGSQDGVIRTGKLTEGRQFAPKQYIEHVIEGGNHAMFGNYGKQKGDGAGLITDKEQQAETVRAVMEAVRE